MDFIIRRICEEEYNVLGDFLYEAIFIPEGMTPPPRTIIKAPELQVYLDDFGQKEGDFGLVAEVDKKLAGAVWVRIMNDYGHIDDNTPSFAISLKKELLNECEKWAKEKGCREFASDCELENKMSQQFHLSMGFKEANRIICFTKEL